ncbi:GLE1-like protein-domain-containing protein [Gongronella butleri]|nr:GLE1-like protein-domain-containing protein [Gongronella butleri]
MELQAAKQAIEQKAAAWKKQTSQLEKEYEERNARLLKLVDEAIALDTTRIEQDKKKEAAEKERQAKEAKEAKDAAAAAEEKKKAVAKAKAEAAAKAEEAKKLSSNKGGASSAGLEEYKKHMQAIENYKAKIKPRLQQDDAFRKKCFEARRLIKRTVIQIQFKDHVIIEKYKLLEKHLLTIKNQDVDAFHVLLNHLGKALLLQVRQEVDGAAFSAYFLAKLTVLLCGGIPELKEYVYGRLLKRCPYLVPNFFDDDPTLTHDEIRRRLHYQYDEEKKEFQPFIQHATQQRCYIMFFAAMVTTTTGGNYPPNPFSISLGWTWFARILNMAQREINPLLIHGFLEIAGRHLLAYYPRQFPKVLNLLYTQIIPSIPIHHNKDNVGAISGLKLYLEDYSQTGILVHIPEVMKASV